MGLLRRLRVEAICAHVGAFLDGLEAGLLRLGCSSLRSPSKAARSDLLGVHPPAGGPALHTMWERLGERGVACSMPDGVLRFSPHWPNDRGQVAHVPAAVREALA